MSFTCPTRSTRPDTITLTPTGRLDSSTVEQFDPILQEALDGPDGTIILDLSELTYLSSAGVRCFLVAEKTMRARGGRAILTNPQPGVKKVLEIARLADGQGLFLNEQEMDAYLDRMQRKMQDGGA